MLKIGIIADDLTGANDTGIQFLKRGLSTIVSLFHPSGPTKVPLCEAWVIDVKSRGCCPKEAYRRTLQAAAWMKNAQPPVIFKKMDSTLRGNVGAECDAVLDIFDPEVLIVAPAFPQLGRITRDGVQLLYGVPIHETELASDPLTPVKESNVEMIVSRQTKHSVSAFKKQFLEDFESFNEHLARIISENYKIIVFDAEMEEDLERMVSYILRTQRKAAWAGSAGLALTLQKLLFEKQTSEVKKIALPVEGNVLVVSGSHTNVNAQQLNALSSKLNVEHIEVNPLDLLADENSNVLVSIQRAIQGLSKRRPVIFSIKRVDSSGIKLSQYANQQNIKFTELSERLLQQFGRSVTRIIQSGAGCQLLVSIGGETSRSICDQLGVSFIELYDEILPGVIHGRASGPEQLNFVTKSGSFGNEDTLIDILRIMKGDIR